MYCYPTRKYHGAVLSILITAFPLIYCHAQTSTSIRFYAHPGFDYISNKDQNSSSAIFRGGPLVTYVTAQITDRVSIAAETNLHYMAVTGAEFELERAFIQYYYKPGLTLRFGRMYNPLGFWNANYNFGLVLQPNIGRPKILNPTHDGGFIQTRDVGLQIEGEGLGKAGLFYRLFVSNGIGKNGGLLGVPYALGENIAYTAQVGIEPLDGLKISVSGNLNQQAEGSMTQYGSAVPEKLSTTLFVASLSNMAIDRKFEFIAEYFQNQHNYTSLPTKSLHGGIVYVGYKLPNKIVPYVFCEFLDFPSGDTYYPAENPYTNQAYVSSNEYNLGLRYKVSGDLVLKFELAYMDQKQFGSSLGFRSQAAFAF